MLIKIISLIFDPTFGGFHDEVVREFLKDKELISARDYLFVKNEIPYLVFVLKYFPYRAEIAPKIGPKEKSSEEPWRKIITDADMGLFNLLRDWRSQKAKKEGLPPYVIFNNQQLATIVKKRPQTLAELDQIEGIGQAKIKRYGEEILAISKMTPEVKAVEEVNTKTDDGIDDGSTT